MRITCFTAALLSSNLIFAATPVNGWYASAFGGYSYQLNNIVKHRDGVKYNGTNYNGGYNAGGRVGYQSNPLRYEFEYTYIHVNAINYTIDYIPRNGVEGDSWGNLMMANIYYDFPDMVPAISPFIGVGIGYAVLQTNLSSTGPIAADSFSASQNSFAYQATAGLTYNFSENYAVNLAYRYSATPQNNAYGRAYQVNMANLGVVYHFDTETYK